MKLTQLQYFYTVCKCNNNMTKAAQELFVTQPCISNALKDLEKEFHVQLFTRQRRRLHLTSEGKVCLEYATQLLSSVSYFEDKMNDLAFQNKRIQVGISFSISAAVIPFLINYCQHQNFDIKIKIIERSTHALLGMIERGELDIAVINISRKIPDTTLFNCEPLYKSETLFCTYKEHPLAREREIYPEQLHEQQLVLLEPNEPAELMILKQLIPDSVSPNVLLCTAETETAKKLIINKCASALLYREVILNEPDIIGIPFHTPDINTIGLCSKKEQYLTKATYQTIDILKDFFNYELPAIMKTKSL